MSAATTEQPELRTIELEGRSFAWRTLGAGEPLLLINGYAATSADWDPTLLAELSRSFELICPDNRGMGGSELGDSQALSIESMAADCERLLDELGLGRAAVAGWSMGSYVAQSLTVRSPERVRALVLMASAPPGPGAVSSEPGVWGRLTDHSGTPREQASRLIALLFPPATAREIDAQFGEVVAAARAQLSTAALDAQERALVQWHSDPHPRRPPANASRQVMVICGDEDVVIPPQNAELLAVLWPGARIEQIVGGGHAFMAQEPERVAALIADFAGAD